MIETIGRQLEDVVLGQRLFSDIEVFLHFFDNHFDGNNILTRFLASQNFPFLLFGHEQDFFQFALDDGVVSAHKPLLMARCDMMQVTLPLYDIVYH